VFQVRHRYRRLRNTTLLLLLASPAWGAAPALADPSLIAHPDVPETAISRNQARLYLTLRVTQWPDHTPLKVFVLPDDAPLHESFVRSVLGLYGYQLRRAWDRQLFSGTGQGPTVVSDREEMLRRVASTPGAIGYIDELAQSAGVKLLQVH